MEVKVILWLLVIYIIWLTVISPGMEYFGNYASQSPLIYDHYVSNQNAFRNYYRVGFENSENIGWKPINDFEHLRPENNEHPECFPDN